KLASDGLLLAAEPSASLFRDIVFGLNPAWFDPSLSSTSLPSAQSPESWQRTLDAAGLVDTSAHKLAADCGGGLLLVGRARQAAAPANAGGAHVLIVTDAKEANGLAAELAEDLAEALAEELTCAGAEPLLAVLGEVPKIEPANAPSHVIHLAGSFAAHSSPIKNIAERCAMLEQCVHSLGAQKANLWVVSPG